MPEELIVVITVEGGCVQSVYLSNDQHVRAIVVDYDSNNTHTLRDDDCEITEVDADYDEDFVAEVMREL